MDPCQDLSCRQLATRDGSEEVPHLLLPLLSSTMNSARVLSAMPKWFSSSAAAEADGRSAHCSAVEEGRGCAWGNGHGGAAAAAGAGEEGEAGGLQRQQRQGVPANGMHVHHKCVTRRRQAQAATRQQAKLGQQAAAAGGGAPVVSLDTSDRYCSFCSCSILGSALGCLLAPPPRR